MWNLVVCDDDKCVLEFLKDILPNLVKPAIGNILYFNAVNTFKSAMRDESMIIDICMLDIKIKDGNGIDLAEDILKINPKCQIVFMSGYDEYYQDVYRVDHAYLLQKPLQAEMVEKAIHRAINRLKKSKRMVFYISNKSGKYALQFDEILYLEKDKRKIILTTVNGEKIEFYGKLDETMEQLPEQLIRCHNSFITNMSHIKHMEKNILVMDDGREIPVSRSYFKNVKAKFVDYISK